MDKVLAEVLLLVTLAIIFINLATNRCFAKCFSSFVMVNFFFFYYLVEKDKYLHHNNRSYKNNFLFYKEFGNLFINVKIKLIFSNSFSDIN